MKRIYENLRLEPAPNGGWVVSGDNGDGRIAPRMIAAYSSDQDMIAGLSLMIDNARETGQLTAEAHE